MKTPSIRRIPGFTFFSLHSMYKRSYSVMKLLSRSVWAGLVAMAMITTIASHNGVLAAEQECDANGVCTASTCVDDNDECETWASQGECDANPKFMMVNCRKSCFVCGDQEYEGDGSDFGVPQIMGNPQFLSNEKSARNRLGMAYRYLQNADIPSEIKTQCVNKHAECTNWAVGGECDGNPVWMKKECAASCQSCDFLAYLEKCPMDVNNLGNVWEAGDLDKMFEKLTSEPYLSKYSVEVLSSPSTTGGPWVLQFDDVLSKTEADHLIDLGAIEGYAPSADVGKIRSDGGSEMKFSNGRTSTNAWCTGVCYRNETALAVANRLSELTGVPEPNSEYLQMLRYEPNQYYNEHHDYIGHHIVRQEGPRILTFYLYLNDVEAGGGTEFTKLGLVVTPKTGRAILWPSVLSEAPSKKDDRTMHAALAVEKGIKYGANAWFHLRDFKGPMKTGCY